MTNVCVSVHIEQPVERVFDYITTAANWPEWHPSTVSVTGATDHPALEGETIVEEVRYGLMHDYFTWNVVGREAPNRWEIRSKSRRYKQRVRIAYTLSSRNGGTQWLREMEFFWPKHLQLLERLIFSKLVERNSQTAVRQLKEVMERTGG